MSGCWHSVCRVRKAGRSSQGLAWHLFLLPHSSLLCLRAISLKLLGLSFSRGENFSPCGGGKGYSHLWDNGEGPVALSPPTSPSFVVTATARAPPHRDSVGLISSTLTFIPSGHLGDNCLLLFHLLTVFEKFMKICSH